MYQPMVEAISMEVQVPTDAEQVQDSQAPVGGSAPHLTRVMAIIRSTIRTC
jgi:hypothetical protein